MDVMAFVTPLGSGTQCPGVPAELGTAGTERHAPILVEVLEWSDSLQHGWKAVLRLGGSKRAWEAYWRGLGIARPSPSREAGEPQAKISLALGGPQSDESSCATGAEKEVHMTNAEHGDTAAKEGAVVGHRAPKLAGAARKGNRPKEAPPRRKGALSRARSGRRGQSKTGTNSGKKAGLVSRQKPRPESKGGQILALIGRAKGATLSELRQASSWQAHSVRGFLSTAAKKYGLRIESTKSDGGERQYRLQKK